MDVLAALLPPAVMAAAFIAIVVAVKRRADSEQRSEDQYLDALEAAEQEQDPDHRTPKAQ